MNSPPHKGSDMENLVFRRPELKDGSAVHTLIKNSKPLDCNSLYSYLLLTAHFADTCIVAEHKGGIAGYISAYVHPGKSDTLFIWQVAVSEELRGRGLAVSMLTRLLNRKSLSGLSFLETTVTPSNVGSSRLFESVARKLRAPLVKSEYFSKNLFGPEAHEEELLFKIGPFTTL